QLPEQAGCRAGSYRRSRTAQGRAPAGRGGCADLLSRRAGLAGPGQRDLFDTPTYHEVTNGYDWRTSIPMSTTLNISVYKRGVRQDTVPVGDIQSALANPDTFVWLGLHEPDELMLQSLKKELALHELAVEDAHRAYQRPKIETYPGSLFIVLHM